MENPSEYKVSRVGRLSKYFERCRIEGKKVKVIYVYFATIEYILSVNEKIPGS